jgi:hypothetical protein
MHDKVLSLVAAAALLASVAVANAKGPVTLTDVQLDKATAGDAASTNQVSYLLSVSTAELGRLMALSSWTLGVLNGVPLSPLPVTP